MTQPEIYTIGLMLVLLACAYGMMRWNRYLIRSHRTSHSEDRPTRS
jgi:hypothetical protein